MAARPYRTIEDTDNVMAARLLAGARLEIEKGAISIYGKGKGAVRLTNKGKGHYRLEFFLDRGACNC